MRMLVLVLALVAACAASEDVSSVARDVQVVRDEWGVPHVYAHSDEDAAFALGYVTAQDRLFQLDLDRRRALGRVAEMLGQAALADDIIARTLGFGALGEQAAADLHDHDPAIYRALSAYAAGIDAFVADAVAGRNGATLPPEYADLDPSYRPAPWRVADTMALLKAELFVLAVHPESDLLGYAVSVASGTGVYLDLFTPEPLEPIYITGGFPDAGSSTPRTGSREEPACREPPREARAAALLAERIARYSGRSRVGPVGASNNFVLCGGATQSGGTMLANDPHLGVDLPTNFYEMHFEVDDPARPLRVAGFGFPGAPAIALGHNDASAWGVTTVEADIADSYLETVDGNTVAFDGKQVAMQTHSEAIVVRGAGPIGSGDTVTQIVRVVPHHGPVLSDAVPDIEELLGAHHAISVRWEGFGITHEARAFFDLARAHTFADFQASLDSFQAGLFNFVYAGADGEIGYYPHADYPIRAQLDPQHPPFGVVPGDGGYEWTGALIPNDRIPQLHDPASCRVFTANNDPAGVTAGGDVLDKAFYFGGTFDYGLRARRIRDRLDALPAGGATLDDFASIQADVHSGLYDHFASALVGAARGAQLSATAQQLVAIVAAWNGDETSDSIAPTIFNAWYSQLLVDVFADDLPLTFAQVATDDRTLAPLLQHLLAGDAAPSGHDYLGGLAPGDLIVRALEEIAVALPQQLGADTSAWTWGSLHTNTFDHPLGGRYSIGPVALGGGLSTVSAARYSPVVGGNPVIRPDISEAPNARIGVELTPAGVRMRTVLPTGESGVVDSPHYADQLADWTAVRLHDAHFDRADVLAHAAAVITFPAGFPTKTSELR